MQTFKITSIDLYCNNKIIKITSAGIYTKTNYKYKKQFERKNWEQSLMWAWTLLDFKSILSNCSKKTALRIQKAQREMLYITSVKKFIKIWKDVISRDGSAKK